jgi:tetratricopeptide (TPR) repeat protein
MTSQLRIDLRAWCLAALYAALVVSSVHAQDSLDAVRTLYTDASYEDALAMVNRLSPASTTDTSAIGRYRALCLLALGRPDEAEAAFAEAVTADPAMTLSEQDASPSVRARLAAVRQRTMPGILRARLNDARSAFVERRYAEALRGFTNLVTLLDNQVVREATSDTGDLVVIARGYLDLVEAAAPPPLSIAGTASEAAALGTGVSTAVLTPPPGFTLPLDDRITNGTTTNGAMTNDAMTDGAMTNVSSSTHRAPEAIVPPVTISQQIPRPVMQTLVTPTARMVVEVLISEQGRVERATVTQSFNTVYDAMLVTATKDWTYQPATRGGRPVKYLKVLELTFQR